MNKNEKIVKRVSAKRVTTLASNQFVNGVVITLIGAACLTISLFPIRLWGAMLIAAGIATTLNAFLTRGLVVKHK